MSTIITRFQEDAAGPTELCRKLRVSTKPVRIFFRSSGTLHGLKTEVPENVLGGDIFSLFSQGLQQLLLEPEMSEQEEYPVRPRKTGFTAKPARPDGKEPSDFLQKSLLPEESKDNFSPLLTASESSKKSFPFTGSAGRNGKQETFNDSPMPEIAQSHPFLKALEHHANRPAFPTEDESGAGGTTKTERADSIFVEKLREYWHLHCQPQTNDEPEGNQRTGVAKERGRKVPAQTLPDSPLASQSWPRMTGRQVAQKLGAFVSGDIDTSGQAGQPLPSGAPEKIEIQNTFHIEVKSGRDRTTELSERIADILREQALQHGIDIT